MALTTLGDPLPIFTVSANPSTLNVPSPAYPSIQSAVNAAAPGDTILVAAGIYREHVVVTKSVNITGAGPATTTIFASGSGPGVNITNANSVSLQGLSINNTSLFDAAIFVNSSSLVLISNNQLYPSAQTVGAYILDSSQISVIKNLFGGSGVGLQGGFGNNIQYDNVTGNSSTVSIGIAVYSSVGNKITDNSIRMNRVGLELWKGSTGNVVARNLVSSNSFWGVSVQNSTNNLLFENSIEFNNADPRNSEGINLQNAVGNRFYHNNIRGNAVQAAAVYPPGDQNIWDNTTGSSLKSDPKIMFVDSKATGHWDFNDTVVYDTDANGMYDVGEPIIASVVGSAPPAPGTIVKSFSGLKFVDRFGSGIWKRGDPVVNDTNSDNVFEAGEPGIAGVGGNFWSDYTGRDNGANGFGLDGIGDTLIPWPCPNGGTSTATCPAGSPRALDWYPLMTSWVPPNMNVTATATPVSGFPPVQVSFRAEVVGGTGPYNYSWNFGDGSTGLGSSILHSYSVRGSYVAVVTVSDSSFRTRSDSVGVSVLVGSLLVRVVDVNKKPLLGVNVTSTLQPTGQATLGAVSNSSGIVFFNDLRNGTYSIRAAGRGYITGLANLVVSLGRVNDVTLALNTVPVQSSGLLLWLGLGALAGGIAGTIGLYAWRTRRKRTAKAAILPSLQASRETSVAPPGGRKDFAST